MKKTKRISLLLVSILSLGLVAVIFYRLGFILGFRERITIHPDNLTANADIPNYHYQEASSGAKLAGIAKQYNYEGKAGFYLLTDLPTQRDERGNIKIYRNYTIFNLIKNTDATNLIKSEQVAIMNNGYLNNICKNEGNCFDKLINFLLQSGLIRTSLQGDSSLTAISKYDNEKEFGKYFYGWHKYCTQEKCRKERLKFEVKIDKINGDIYVNNLKN